MDNALAFFLAIYGAFFCIHAVICLAVSPVVSAFAKRYLGLRVTFLSLMIGTLLSWFVALGFYMLFPLRFGGEFMGFWLTDAMFTLCGVVVVLYLANKKEARESAKSAARSEM